MLTPIEQVRLNIQDNTVGFYFLTDAEIQHLLDSSNSNVGVASMKAAQIVLFQLSQRGDESVDVFSLKGSRAADTYRQALEMYIKNPSLNPMMEAMTMYVGGVSKTDIHANDANPDNNVIQSPSKDRHIFPRFPSGWTVL